jgi:hypothetical protein
LRGDGRQIRTNVITHLLEVRMRVQPAMKQSLGIIMDEAAAAEATARAGRTAGGQRIL